MEFGTTDGDYSLTKAQMDTIPNVIDGHTLSKNDKYELAFGLLEKQLYGESYELLDSGEILKIIWMKMFFKTQNINNE
jgi:hypothetical protein